MSGPAVHLHLHVPRPPQLTWEVDGQHVPNDAGHPEDRGPPLEAAVPLVHVQVGVPGRHLCNEHCGASSSLETAQQQWDVAFVLGGSQAVSRSCTLHGHIVRNTKQARNLQAAWCGRHSPLTWQESAPAPPTGTRRCSWPGWASPPPSARWLAAPWRPCQRAAGHRLTHTGGPACRRWRQWRRRPSQCSAAVG